MSAKSQYRKCHVKVGTLLTQLGLTLTINVIFNIYVNTCVQLYSFHQLYNSSDTPYHRLRYVISITKIYSIP